MDQPEAPSHDVLRDEILADAQRQAERIIRKAKREAKATIDKATTKSQEERDAKLAAARADAEQKRTVVFATLPVAVGRMRAAHVEQELMALCDTVRARLLAREGFAYRETIVTLAAEAIAGMEGDAFVLELSEKDQKILQNGLVTSVLERVGQPNLTLTLSTEAAQITSGVLVRDPQGRQVWDNSLAARLDRMWPLLRSKIAKQMKIQDREEPSGGQS